MTRTSLSGLSDSGLSFMESRSCARWHRSENLPFGQRPANLSVVAFRPTQQVSFLLSERAHRYRLACDVQRLGVEQEVHDAGDIVRLEDRASHGALGRRFQGIGWERC
jgi:hypothetical protein